MKLLFSILLLFAVNVSFGQQPTNQANQATAKFFAQCMIDIPNNTELVQLNEDMKLNPNIEMVRLDHNTQRALIITHGLTNLTEQDLRSWFGSHGPAIYCIQIGVYGVDTMNPYPFTNCQ